MEDALEGHRLALTFSGRSGILNRSLLESAIARPYSGHYRPIHQKPAALVHGIVKNHAFVDGNKQTAVFLMDLLLKKSGYRLETRNKRQADMAVEAMILDVASGSIDGDGNLRVVSAARSACLDRGKPRASCGLLSTPSTT